MTTIPETAWHSVLITPTGSLGCSFGIVDGDLHVVSLSSDGWARVSGAVAVGDVLRSANSGRTLPELKKALKSAARPLKLQFSREVSAKAEHAHLEKPAPHRTHVLEVTFDHAGKLGMSFGIVDGELHVVKSARDAEAHPDQPIVAGDVLVGFGGAPATIAAIKEQLLSGARPLALAVRRVEHEELVRQVEAQLSAAVDMLTPEKAARPPPSPAAADEALAAAAAERSGGGDGGASNSSSSSSSGATASTSSSASGSFARRLSAAAGPPTTISISIDVAGQLGMRLGRVDGQLQVVTLAEDGWAGATKALAPGDSLRLLNGASCKAAKLKESLTSGSRPLRLGFERFDGVSLLYAYRYYFLANPAHKI